MKMKWLAFLLAALLLVTSSAAAQVQADPGQGARAAATLTPRAYLAAVLIKWPPVPEPPLLLAINNPGNAGSYVVNWSLAARATSYELQEAGDPGFGVPTTVYSGTFTVWQASNKAPGAYYYRVRGANTWGNGPWSATQATTVVSPLPNDPFYSSQWHLPKVNAPAAWQLTHGSGIVVAVVDTGSDLLHPDLQGKLVAGWNVVANNANPQDDEGHGTHVTGIIAAATNNGVGVAGIAWDAKVMPVKVLNSTGNGYTSDVASGITWAANHGAKVINLSLGGSTADSVLQSATDYAWSKNCLVVAAAGNNAQSGNPVTYPAANPNVMAVAAVDENDAWAYFSEHGSFVDIAAPGYTTTCPTNCGIYSTLWTYGLSTYDWLAGTSMASPVVAGSAALVWARNPALTNQQVANALLLTAVDLGAPGPDEYYGYGRVNTGAAVTTVASAAAQAQSRPAKSAIQPGLPAASVPAAPGVVLLRFKPAAQTLDRQSTLARYGLQVAGELPDLGILKVRVPAGAEYQTAGDLLADPAVEFAQPDYVISLIR